jgi:putative ABC transport system permease protein
VHQVNAGYPETLGIRLINGRMFTDRDVTGREPLAFINQAFVRRYSPDRDPIGRLVRLPRMKEPPLSLPDPSFQIIGVVKDVINSGDQIEPEIYLPYTMTGRADRLIVLARGDPSSITGAVRSQVYAVDRNQPVMDIKTMESVMDEEVYSYSRFKMVLFSVFAGLGLALVVVGVHGLIAHAVAQQTPEIGLRMALGADFVDVFRMVIANGVRLLLIGIAIGLAGSVAAARVMAAEIAVSQLDAVTFAGVSILLFSVGLGACFWPALRAARLDPMNALRGRLR